MAVTTDNQKNDEDHHSLYGSISGETYASMRSRRSLRSRRLNSIDQLARNLREYHAQNGEISGSKRQSGVPGVAAKPRRFNKSFHHYRFIVSMFGGLSVGLMLVLRYNITISILRMVNQTHMYLEENPNKTIQDFIDEGYTPGGEFNWNNEIIAIILSCYMFAYTLPQMPCSKLSAFIGCRLSVPIGLTICAIASLLTPYAAYLGWEYLVVLRLVNGLGASPIMPMMLNLVEIWMPYEEITVGLSIAQVTNCIMCTLIPLVSGYLAAIHWSLTFYVPAVATLIFSAAWLFFISDSPEECRLISEKELSLILGCDKISQSDPASNHDKSVKNNAGEPAPVGSEIDELQFKADSWLQVFKVQSFYAYVIMWCFYCSSFTCFTFILPTYLRQFLKIPIAQNGFYCFLTQLGTILAVLWPHPFINILRKWGFSLTASRRMAHCILCSMVAASWIYVGLFHNNQIILMFINRCFHSSNDIVVTGSLMSNYAKAGLSGITFSLVNTVGNLSIVASSPLIGWILDYTGQSREGWTWIWCGLGVSQLLSFLIFATFCHSEPIVFKNKEQLRISHDLERNRAEKLSAVGNSNMVEPVDHRCDLDDLETKGAKQSRD